MAFYSQYKNNQNRVEMTDTEAPFHTGDAEIAAGKLRHISDVETWGKPDRSFLVFVILSFAGGLIGADHAYLRSFDTATKKFIVNCCTFGLWYFWDLIQIIKDGDKVRREGLSSPLDWIRGIGRGTFMTGGSKCDEKQYEPQKSYLVYAFLAIFLGGFGADKFYMGEGWQGIVKLFSCFNVFLFLFGWLWVAWDAFHAFFMTNDILKSGISAPLPYSWFFTKTIDSCVFKISETNSAEEISAEGKSKEGKSKLGFLDMIAKMFNFPNVPQFPWRNVYADLVAPLMTPPLVNALRAVNTMSMPTMPTMPTATSMLAMPTAPSMLAMPTAPSMSAMPSIPHGIPHLKHALPLQSGGARNNEPMGPGPVIAGVLTAIVLAGGLKGFYDVISKQYG